MMVFSWVDQYRRYSIATKVSLEEEDTVLR